MVEDHARLQGAEAAGAHSSAHIMIIGQLAPPPAELAACACAVKMLSGEWTRQCCRPVAVHPVTASSAAERRWCRIWRARSGRDTHRPGTTARAKWLVSRPSHGHWGGPLRRSNLARRGPGRRQAGLGGGQRPRCCPTAEANALAAGAAGGESWLDHAAARRRHMHYACSDPGGPFN